MSGKNKTEDRIIESRVGLLFKHPFYGQLATRLELVDGGEYVPTAGTDGRKFYYNQEFFEAMTDDEVTFVVAHEIMHCVYDHMERREGRDPRLWNCAGDFVINHELVEAGIGKMPDLERIMGPNPDPEGPPPQCCYDPKYAGMGADEIYEVIKKDPDFNQDSFDVHFEMGDPNGEGGGEGTVKLPEELTGKMTKEEQENLKEDIKKAVMDAAKSAAGAGNIPGSVKRMIDDITNPKMDWREMLQMQIQSLLKNDYTFARPSRKNSTLGGIYLPGLKHDTMVDAVCWIDTSGSISQSMLRDFLGEIQGIMEQFTEFRLIIGCFDTQVHNVVEFSSDNLDDIGTYELGGFGGTCFESFYTYMKEEGIEPEKMIVFTDGYPFGSWGDEHYCDVIWVLHGNPNGEAPFGITTHYEKYQ